MSRAAILYFTQRGGETAGRIAEALHPEFETRLYPPGKGLCEMAGLFEQVELIVFVGACGIAVRGIAPYLRSKTADPAVIVADERGEHVISLLSGHIGGANALSRSIAAGIGGEAVITTATDVNHRFAADEWAARHNLAICSMDAARRFAAEILRRDLPLYSDFAVEGALPGGLYPGDAGSCGVAVSCRNVAPFDDTLLLAPRILHLGIGCKRGTSAERIDEAVRAALSEHGVCPQALSAAASIDVKRDETGLHEYCASAGLPLAFYSADELSAVAGEFTASEFVKRTVGVDNVCERAAMLSAGEGAQIIVRKYCAGGVTVALAQQKWGIRFE